MLLRRVALLCCDVCRGGRHCYADRATLRPRKTVSVVHTAVHVPDRFHAHEPRVRPCGGGIFDRAGWDRSSLVKEINTATTAQLRCGRYTPLSRAGRHGYRRCAATLPCVHTHPVVALSRPLSREKRARSRTGTPNLSSRICSRSNPRMHAPAQARRPHPSGAPRRIAFQIAVALHEREKPGVCPVAHLGRCRA